MMGITLVFLSLVAPSLCLSCTHPVYCTGPLLDAVQTSAIFNDSKTFVDMPMKYPPEQVLAAFKEQITNSSTRQELLDFVNDNFYPAGSDLEVVVPVDWTPNPSFLSQLNDTTVRAFALAVHDKWHDLVRAWNNSFCDGCYSHLPATYPFVIAGSRFREFYYWDSYWTLEGLLVSDMFNTSRGHLENFLNLVQDLGFVPNGGRIYYVNRSQPPLLTQMILRYYQSTNDLAFLEQAVPILNSEYNYWMSNTSVEVEPGHILNRYYVINSAPRPESYLPDVTLASTVPPSYVAELYQQIATGAETGWDFSSRWMSNQPNLATLQTTQVIPVDLNSILYKNELTLAAFYQELRQPAMQRLYLMRAAQRLVSIQKLLWNDALGMWSDRFLNGSLSTEFYPSNLVPIWAGVYLAMTSAQVEGMLKSVTAQGIFSYEGGVPTSFIPTGQQWDFPNGWAPLQHLIISGLNEIASTPIMDPRLRQFCEDTAFQLASHWLTSNYCGWNATGMMFEKYNVTMMGNPGGGGEYTVQDGFGWTNGVALHLLQLYGNKFTLGSCN